MAAVPDTARDRSGTSGRTQQGAGRTTDSGRPVLPSRRGRHVVELVLAALAAAGIAAAIFWFTERRQPTPPVAAPAAAVTVSPPLVETLASRSGFLGQFSAVDEVDVRAQVGGILTEIDVRDGQLVRKGDLLFVVDPRPYEIRLVAAVAAVRTTQSHIVLAQQELYRAQALRRNNFGTAETVDQRVADLNAADAAQESAVSSIRDAQLDLDYCKVKAPFDGRISSHRVSVGSLVSGSRAGSSPTTLLTTIVSTDPIYLNFDMSENDYLAYARAHQGRQSGGEVDFRLGDEDRETRQARLDFIDNVIDRASGTIHARATAANPDGFLVPGSFARLSLVTGTPKRSLLVPETAVSLDQSNHVVMTVGTDDVVVAKVVTIGDLLHGMRVVTDGLAATDLVVVDGLVRAIPGRKVAPHPMPTAKG